MNKLKQLRLDKKLTQSNVAKVLGISVRMYQYLEASQRNPSWKLSRKLEDFFGGVSARELLSAVIEPTSAKSRFDNHS